MNWQKKQSSISVYLIIETANMPQPATNHYNHSNIQEKGLTDIIEEYAS